MPHLPYLLLQILAFVFFSAATLTLNPAHIFPDDIHAPSSLMRSNLQYPSNRSPIARDLHELQDGWVRTIWHSFLRLVYFPLRDAHTKICAGRPNREIPFISARGSRRVSSRKLL